MTLLKLALGLLLLTASCVAQTMVGLQGGINWSNYDIKPTAGNVYGTGLGPNFGLLVQSKLPNELYVIGGLSYVEKTIPWLVHQYLESSSPDIEFHYEFTQLSVSLKKEFPIYGLGPYIMVGGTCGFLNSASYVDDRFGGPAYTIGWSNDARRTDFDLNLGLGLSYHLDDAVSIFADVKYSYDLVSLSKEGSGNTYIRSTQGSCGILVGL